MFLSFYKETNPKKIVVSQNAHCSRRLDASTVAFKECETTTYNFINALQIIEASQLRSVEARSIKLEYGRDRSLKAALEAEVP